MNEHDQEQLSGFIFMCNGRTKPQCYMYRVFGLPAGKLDVVEKIKPGMKLFLFDFELKLLYGIYEATSVGTLHLEQTAFNGQFPAQVRFKIYQDCLPLHESSFRHAIEYNYQKGFNFKQELNKQQVVSLLSLFRPLIVPEPGLMQPMLLQTVENQSMVPFPKDSNSCAQIFKAQNIQHTGFRQFIGCSYPVDPNVTRLQPGSIQPISKLSHIQQSVPFPQQHYSGSSTNMPHSHPTMATQVFPAQSYQYYVADVQQPYAAEYPTQTVADQYNSYGTIGIINQQLGARNMHLLPLEREEETVQQQDGVIQYYNPYLSTGAPHTTSSEEETVQQQDGVIQYYNPYPSTGAPHATSSELSYMPTMGVPEAANQTPPLAYFHPFQGAAPTHHRP